MKLLLDQNISRRVLSKLLEAYPRSNHVVYLNLDESPDTFIWEHAKKEGFTIVSKDKDFLQRSMLMGHPPKVVHLNTGNCSIQEMAEILMKHHEDVRKFLEQDELSYLILA